jgi:putative DNA primase/helicase
MLDATVPSLIATEFLGRRSSRLVYWHGDFCEWVGTHYEIRERDEIEAQIYRFLDCSVTTSGTPFKTNSRVVGEVLRAMQARILVSPRYPANANLGTGQTVPGLIPCRNGRLDIATGTLQDHSDEWLVFNSLPFEYEPDLPEPQAWLSFLKTLWAGDEGKEGGAVCALQEMIGYIVSGRTDLQKIFLLLGPPRSGKGTIAAIIEKLVGAQNYVGVPFAQLGHEFGMAVLIGKSVMIVPDARPAGAANLSMLTERLLNISGEDVVSVRRKYRDDWTGSLSTRIVVLTNEVPRLHDMSGAIATRFVPIRMTQSFLGREDVDLKAKLRAELPQILNWAIRGARRVYERGAFVIPKDAEPLIEEVREAAAPHVAFLRERVLLDAEASVTKQQLYLEFRRWCEDNGHHACAENIFASRIRMTTPSIREVKPHGQSRCWVGICFRRDDDPDSAPNPVDHAEFALMPRPTSPRSNISASILSNVFH